MFICIRCAGIHRNLGVHISRVKSVNLDSWTPEQIEVGIYFLFICRSMCLCMCGCVRAYMCTKYIYLLSRLFKKAVTKTQLKNMKQTYQRTTEDLTQIRKPLNVDTCNLFVLCERLQKSCVKLQEMFCTLSIHSVRRTFVWLVHVV